MYLHIDLRESFFLGVHVKPYRDLGGGLAWRGVLLGLGLSLGWCLTYVWGTSLPQKSKTICLGIGLGVVFILRGIAKLGIWV